MPDNDLDPVDRWLGQQVWPMSPPSGTYERITRRARHRRVRKAMVSVGSAAAVVVAIAVAVPLGLSGGSPPGRSIAAGSTSSATPRSSGSAFSKGTDKASTTKPDAGTPAPSATASPGITNPGFVPANFQPFSVTFESASTGWVIGPAGTSGSCGAQQDSTICTSIARTGDGGQTWSGVPAPVAPGPDDATGVSGLRFLDTSYGWAFGPDLYSTTDGGEHWTKVGTGGYSVTDLETTNGRAYALFGQCASPAGTDADVLDNCTSYTLETSVAGSGKWAPVSGVPQSLTSASSKYPSAVIEIGGSTGYLAAPDGELYAGPAGTAGGTWHAVGQLPCSPETASADGLPQDLMLASAGTTSSGATRLAVVCAAPSVQDTVLYESGNGGASWTLQTTVGTNGTSLIGEPESLTALSDGTLILATDTSAGGSAGLYRLAPGATKWAAATLEGVTGSAGDLSFSYVGMTTPEQGVAVGSDSSFTGIWMTTDGGLTWTPRQIQGG